MRFFLIIILLLTIKFLFAIEHDKQLVATRIHTAPKIDGKEDDECWKHVQPIQLNYQFEPSAGAIPTEKTEVRMVYNNNAVYVFAHCFDKHIDSIQHIFTTRGNVWKKTENMYLFFDTYHDGQNAFCFGVSVDNVQDDFKATSGGVNIDGTWDAVWDSKTSYDKNGWYAEFKIPFSALRFPKTTVQQWRCDFTRELRRKREIISWCTTPPTTEAFVPTMLPVKGIDSIKPPVRISISPYLSSYVLKQGNQYGQAFKAGADVKYGISESFTLDMILVPDFGQVVSDQLVKNLTPFEIQYQERRQFFLEGAELFSKNNLFYSRRVGQFTKHFKIQHQNDGVVATQSAKESQLINAFKISGKTKNNLSIGIFNAITNQVKVNAVNNKGDISKIIYEPITNYNIVVAEQTLKNNSHIGFINTSVVRLNNGIDANVTGADIKLYNKKNDWTIGALCNVSQLININNTTGSQTAFGIGKIRGMWQGSYNVEAVSAKFNSNDLGYLSKSNFIMQSLALKQFFTKPFGKVIKMTNTFAVYKENRFENLAHSFLQFQLRNHTDWKNYLTMVSEFTSIPTSQKDFYESRTNDGRYLINPGTIKAAMYISSDYRKTLAIDANIEQTSWFEKNRRMVNYMIAPRIQAGRKCLINYAFDKTLYQNQLGFVDNVNSGIYLGKRNVKEISNALTIRYAFNPYMAATLTARHYWNGGRYNSYYLLNANGSISNTTPTYIADYDFNAWSVDVVYTWQFAPGSLLTIAWKNLTTHEPQAITQQYFKNFDATFRQQLANSFSIKALWYIDAGNVLKQKK